MEFNELLEARRSIRAYKAGTVVDIEDLKEIIKAAQQAPSWKNSQTARYYIASSEEMVEKVRTECLPEFNQNNSKNAPVLIVTAFVKARAGFERDGSPTNELGDEWGAYDLGLQNGNLILKAKDLGYDTLIMGIRDEKALRTILGIPETEEVVSVISLGVRDVEPAKPKRKEVEEIAKFF